MKNIYLMVLLASVCCLWTGCAGDRDNSTLDSSTVASPGDPNMGHPKHNSPNSGNS